MGAAVAVLRRTGHGGGRFTWRWTIVGISVFLTAADLCYFYALSLPGAMISIVSMLRRGSVIVPFVYGVIVLRERNIRAVARPRTAYAEPRTACGRKPELIKIYLTPWICTTSTSTEWPQAVNCAITVCDTDGVILYMNERACATFASHGDLIGKNLFCLPLAPQSQEKIRHMLSPPARATPTPYRRTASAKSSTRPRGAATASWPAWSKYQW